ncbi:EAL domain-containing protein [Mycolicibacterium sp. F2034L]|uniref:sensor domain-containing phosphodiesterase n=1 Tax=Mycolicibacterium sp. F2034L TaxID=2926422 RepID=UPI001FF12B6B|nr:EAL domain-containing protein [Mycolicibacterium sp. F2034L]MCK0176987.1 EAL domain-containing protein [Mycolicibacterium sp. F2034L]
MLEPLGIAASGQGVVSAFQPVVRLPEESVVGYEALARWPELRGVTPQAVIAYAEAHGSLDELDRACIAAAVNGAVEQQIPDGALLLVNCEPGGDHHGIAADPALTRAREHYDLVFELTERNLLAHPGLLLRTVTELRDNGVSVALDDVGSHPASAALLDVLRPDLVKLDMGLLERRPDREQARTIAAVLAYHERTGATIVAEGIETDQQVEQALSLGATYGQGYRFGRAVLRVDTPAVAPMRPTVDVLPAPAMCSLFDLVSSGTTIRSAPLDTMVALSQLIGEQAGHGPDPAIVLTAIQRDEFYNDGLRERYRAIAENSPLVAVFADRAAADFGAGVRGVALRSDDPLSDEWVLLALGPHFAAALVTRLDGARQNPWARWDELRTDLAITYDRDLVVRLARDLLARIP